MGNLEDIYMVVKDLTEPEAAHIAGLIDGEGTITLTRKHRNENRQLCISISNTELELLEFVLYAVGAGKITGKRIAQDHHTPSYTYSIYNRWALSLLGQLSRYLRSYKSKRAAIIQSDYVRLTPRNGKYSKKLAQQRKAFEELVLSTKPRTQTGLKKRGCGFKP
jgi:hypothetical protein